MGSYFDSDSSGRQYQFIIKGDTPTAQEQAWIDKKLGREPAPPPATGDMGSLEAGLRNIYADTATMAARTAYGLGAPESAQSILDYAQATRERTNREYRPTITEFSQIGGLGDLLKYLGGMGGQSIGYMIPALGGAALAAPLAPFVGGPLAAGAIGSTAVSAPAFFGSNIQEQMEQNKVGLGDTAVLPAAGAAAVQSALNLVTPAQFGVLARLGSIAGKDVLAAAEQEVADRTWATFVKELGPRAAKAAVTEAGTETLQEALAVFQANPEKIYNMDGETANRLANAAFGGLVLGGGLGALGRSQTDKEALDRLGRKYDTESATAKADIVAARNAWFNLRNMDANAARKEGEATQLEREADDLMGFRDFSRMPESPFSVFDNYEELIGKAEDVGTGPGPMYSLGMRGGQKRVTNTFLRTATPLVERGVMGLSAPDMWQIAKVGHTAMKRAEEIMPTLAAEEQAAGRQVAQEELSPVAFMGALSNIGLYKNASDAFVFKAAADATDAYEDIKDLWAKADALGDEGVSSAMAEEVTGEGAATEEEGGLAAAGARLTITEGPAAGSFSVGQLANATRLAQMVSVVLNAEATRRYQERERARAEGKDPKAEEAVKMFDRNPNMMTADERTGLVRNSKKLIEDINFLRALNAPRKQGENNMGDRLRNIAAELSLVEKEKAQEAGKYNEVPDTGLTVFVGKRPPVRARNLMEAYNIWSKLPDAMKPVATFLDAEQNTYGAEDIRRTVEGFVTLNDVLNRVARIRDSGLFGKQLIVPDEPGKTTNLSALQGGRLNKEFADKLMDHAEGTIEQIRSFDAGRRKVNKRSEEEIQAERERYKVLHAVEDLIYGTEDRPPNIAEAKRLADTLGNITLYSIDGKSWSDDPAKLREADPKRYEALLASAKKAIESGEGRAPLIKKLTMPYWEFYKRSGKSKVKGTSLYRIGSNVKELVRETDEYFKKKVAEYWLTGGKEPAFVDIYSGTRPEDIAKRMKDPLITLARTRYKKETGKRLGQEDLPDRVINARYRIGEKPTLFDVDADITNRMSFPEIMQDIGEQYVGFKGLQLMGFLQFNKMAETGEVEADPSIRRRLMDPSTAKLIEDSKKSNRAPSNMKGPTLAVDFNKKLDEVIAADRVGSFVASLGGPQEVRPPQTRLTPEELALQEDMLRAREESAAPVVSIDTTQRKYEPRVEAKKPPAPSTIETKPPEKAQEVVDNFRKEVAVIEERQQNRPVEPRKAKAQMATAQAQVAEDIDNLLPDDQEQLYQSMPDDIADAVALTFSESNEPTIDIEQKPPAPSRPKQVRRPREVKRRSEEQVPTYIEGDGFDKSDPRWGEPDPASKPEEGPAKGPSSKSIIRPNLKPGGFTTIYSSNNLGWTTDKARAESFGGEIKETTLPNEVINRYGALSKSSKTLYFKDDSRQYMTVEQLGYESEAPVRTYLVQTRKAAPEGKPAKEETPKQEAPRGEAPKQKAPPTGNITLYSVDGKRWHPNKDLVSQFGEVQEATIPMEMAAKHGRKLKIKIKEKEETVFIFPRKGVRDIEFESREQARKTDKMNTVPIPSGRMMLITKDGKDFTPSASVRGAHKILAGMTGKTRANMRVRDEAGNIYTPAQIQNFVDRINAAETDPQRAQAEKDAQRKIDIDAENIRRTITEISAALKRMRAKQLRQEAEKERAANAPARAAAEKTLKQVAERRKQAALQMRALLDRIGMKNLRVEIVETIAGDAEGDVVEGKYDPARKLIQIAEDVWNPDMPLNEFVDKISGVLAHEVFHYMKAANAFSAAEWATLVKHARNAKARDRGGKLSMTWAQRAAVLYRDPTLTKDKVAQQVANVEEEAIAEAFRDFVVNGVQAPPQVQGLFRRVLGWIRGLFAYKSAKAEKIFADIMSGKYDDATYNIQATGPQNAQTFSIAQKFRVSREERRAEEQKRKAAEAAKKAWREQEARVGGLTLTPRGTSEGYRQGRGAILREKRREAIDREAEEARKAIEEARRIKEKYMGRRTWVTTDGTPTVPTAVTPTPPTSVKFSRAGVRLDYMPGEATTITELAGAGPDATAKYYSFRIMNNAVQSAGQIHGMVDDSNPSVFYVMQANIDPDNMSPEETASLMRMLRKDLGPDILEIRNVGAKVEDTFKQYARISNDMLARYDDLIDAVRKSAYVDPTKDRTQILAYADFLEDMKPEVSYARDVGDMLFDVSSNAQVDMIEQLERSNPGVSRALSELLRADARRMETNRVAVAEQVGVKYAKYNLNPTRIRQVQNQEVYAAAANMVRVGVSKLGFGPDAANYMQRLTDEAIQRLQDKLLPLGRIVDELRKKGLDLPSEMDAYHRYNTMRDRTADRIRVMQEQVINPLFDMIRTSVNFDKNDVDSLRQVAPRFADYVEAASSLNKGFAEAYAAAMHAPERNAVGAQRNINSQNPADLYGSGFDTNEALAAQRWFAAHKSYPEILKIHRGMMRMVEYINALRHAYHLSPDWDLIKHGEQFIAAGYPDGFKYYVPLRGIGDEDPDIDPNDPNDKEIAEALRVGKGISTQYREDRAFLGRGSFIDPQTGQMILNRPPPMILEHMAQMGFQAAIRGEKNFVGQGILRLLSTFGGEMIDQYGRPVQLNKLFEVIYDAPIERRLVDGVVKEVQNRNYKNDKNTFITKVRQPDGNIKEVVIKIHDDMLARAIIGTNGYGSEDASKILGFIAPYTRLLGELSTKYNPLFPLTNFPRDLAGAMINLSQHQIDGLPTKVFKQIGPSFRAMWRYQTHMGMQYLVEGKERARKEFIGADGTNWTELIELYQANGGSFDLFATSTLEDMQREINEMIAPDPGNIAQSKRAMKRVGNFIEAYNKAVENSIRLSTFKSMLDEGIDIDTAVRAAKNVTTNYSMGGTWKSNISALWMFFNANIQGNMQILAALARSQRVRNIVGAVMVAGFMQDMIMSMLAGEDDETGENKYDQIPDYILQNKMIFVDPTGVSENGFLSLAMPYGYNGAHNMGRALSRLIRGRYEVQDAVGTTVSTIVDAFNPLGASSSLLNFAAPTLADPIVDLYLNTDWAGRNIYPKTNPFQPDIPLSQRHWNNTGGISKVMTNVIHELTGGTPMREGAVEISPDSVDYLFKYYLGGVGATIGQMASFLTGTIPRAVMGEEVEVREIPIISKFAGNIGSSLNTEKYFKIMDEAKIADAELKKAKDSADYEYIRDTVLSNKQMLQFSGVAKSINSARSAVMTKIRQVENNSTIPEDRKRQIVQPLKDRVKELERSLIRQYNTRIRDAKVQ